MVISRTPVAAPPGDTPLVGRILAAAFTDDPVTRWLFPDGTADREERLARYYALLHRHQYAPHALCERTDAAAAFWVPPEAQEQAVPDAAALRELPELLGERGTTRLHATFALVARHTPHTPHWYLAVLGTEPAARGRGHGGALLRSGLARADAAGLPACLESSQRANLPLYEHFGFTVRAELPLPHGGPPVWQMWREPAG
ncbi:GNAT family N-acetyltransferase [Streptomyces sp. JJ36]|uniref:GNAT family N-acetyltransferase n=1 Tax=Streptomyces sp. JJ36 TaxID=2736645 RepID=UPI001F00AEE5|nr:GNAT family N-acetyltransferase [Streptomyces sp. JJ36]MCF6525947.1 GNAT family N-acetyltransferase [Streptomyces sp. JJ36]